MFRLICIALCSVLLVGCQTTNNKSSLFEDLGGQHGIEQVADRFVRILIADERTEQAFADTDLDRFYEKVVEQFCELAGGPCVYSGDSMKDVHKGMNISEADFNAVVEILQKAMDQNSVSLSAQNRLLALLAPMRSDMLHQ